MPPGPPEQNELLIVSLTPQNLERGALWFEENFSAIKKAIPTHSWWRDNALILEKDLVIKPSFLLRHLVDFGYERAEHLYGKGLFAVQGGMVGIWPINSELPCTIEFHGNTIASIVERKEEARIKPRIPAQSLEKLTPGSFVVHVDHGIGIFRGKNDTREFFVVEYAPPAPERTPDRLFVPVDQKNRLSPYVGFETPRIHRLGGTAWQTTRRKIKEDAEKFARELLALYATRETVSRKPLEGDTMWENTLRESFPFAETADQLHAEEEIFQDLARSRPMDRVLCGDVGFGKTEVAIRAALRVIASGKQVALLAPTTILVAQHEKTFRDRFENIPVTIAMLSRLTTPQDEKQMLKALAEGTVDCVVGTHRLLSKDVTFKNLGLIIIDEEQRFGVKQKEHFKKLRAEVDILSLSATPIPRTLSLALAKLRDLSRLETPPPERIPIVTNVLPHSKKIIAAALAYELSRDGQIYFLHNRIETIGKTKETLVSLKLPHPLHVEIMHGRMEERELIRAMERFRKKECNTLVATTIIENGLDISSANTLIVDDATRLGLAEAHQLRGRIGRGSTQAHAYFLYKPRHLTPKAAERLEALKEYADLGAGYEIALRDLEIRGAGNVLGREQSGAINKVGLNLYCQILADAVAHAKQFITMS